MAWEHSKTDLGRLLSRYIAHDEDAEVLILSCICEIVTSIVRRRVTGQYAHNIDDVLQEICWSTVESLRSEHAPRTESEFCRYVAAIAVNKAHDHYRKADREKRVFVLLEGVDEWDDLSVTHPDVLRRMEVQEICEKFFRKELTGVRYDIAIAILNGYRLREVFERVHYEERTHRSFGTFKREVSEIKKLLETLWNELGDDEPRNGD